MMPNKHFSNVEMGRKGEDTAVRYLLKEGIKILGRNIRTEYGEIDILAADEESLIFVEVKTRRSRKFGFPEESVNSEKQAHMVNCAQAYMQENLDVEMNWRIDVIAINLKPDGKHDFEWFKNAIIS